MQSEEQKVIPEVIVIGAGIAGLICAGTLAEAGKQVLLLEAADRVGGRIRSCPVEGLAEPVELGAEFVHGQPQDLLALLKEAGLETYELTGRSYGWDGASIEVDEDEDEADEATSILDHLHDLSSREARHDQSFSDYMDALGLAAEARQQITSYVEGFNAADVKKISTQALAFQQTAENEIEGNRLFHVKRGYSALIEYIFAKYREAGGTTRLQFTVKRIRWSVNNVTVTGTDEAGNETSFSSLRVVIALPLGVLQSKSVAIDPRPETLDALSLMAMGQVHRITLVFRERFWEKEPYCANDLSFLIAPSVTPSVWWTSHPSNAPVITAWVGGTRVALIDKTALLDATLESLSRIFRMARPKLDLLLLSSHTHDWNTDPLSRGAYSYVCTGGIDASLILSTPMDGTLFLAGEHTDVTGHWGTVHGALRSGVRAASQVMDSLP